MNTALARVVAMTLVSSGPIPPMTLFGSRARGDHHRGSDVDVVVWTDDDHPRAERVGAVALAYYPRHLLFGAAERGELFAAHLVHEGRALNDPGDLLRELRRAYRPRVCHEAEVEAAFSLAEFLLDHSDTIEGDLLGKRIAWCARTIAIAHATRRGRACYSAEALARELGDASMVRLSACKEDGSAHLRLDCLHRFLVRHVRRPKMTRATPRAYAQTFSGSGNSFASKTLAQAASSTLHYL